MHLCTELNQRNSVEIDPNTQVATILSYRSYYYPSHMSHAAHRGTFRTANLFHRFSSARWNVLSSTVRLVRKAQTVLLDFAIVVI